MGLQGQGWLPRERGRPAGGAALARGDTLILAFSHKGRRDPLAGIRAWFLVAGLIAPLWIPAFARMTAQRKGEGIRWLLFTPDFGRLA